MSLNNQHLLSYNPITPSLRHTCLLNKRIIWSGKPFRLLIKNLKSNTGRSKHGDLILYTRSNRKFHKLYRLLDFHYLNFGIPSKIHRIEYDPNRSSFIALNICANGLICYKLQTTGVNASSTLNSYFRTSKNFNLKNGDSFFLRYIPEGSMIHSIEGFPFQGSRYSRSAGTFSIMIRKYYDSNKCLIKLRSGLYKLLWMNSRATLGSVSNKEYKFIKSGKAGRSRWLGIKPNVRGVAMNPVDHPHGGGEGKKSKSVSPKSPWGKIFKWRKTSTNFLLHNPNISTSIKRF